MSGIARKRANRLMTDSTGWSSPPPSSFVRGNTMNRRHLVACGLADALLAGPAAIDDFVERARHALGRKPRWLAPLCRRAFERFGSSLNPRQRNKLIEFIQLDAGYQDAWLAERMPRIKHYFLQPHAMQPRSGALAGYALPDLPTSAALAAWLGVTPEQLEWYADVRHMNRNAAEQLGHYHYRWLLKRSGGVRLVEIPKAALREIQRKILREILDPVMPHDAAHGFRRGHSCLTYAAPHCGRMVVLRMDLQNFFTRIPAAPIHALFETLGYPETVARRLAGLCTNCVPARVIGELLASGLPSALAHLPWELRKRYADAHLPQGAPTSPALANLCALHLDFRLAGLADSLGGAYTRYADDIAISADESLRRRSGAVSALVAAIAAEERFEINHHKTRVMHRSGRQRLTGIVVNTKPNVLRPDYDELKAILHNCVRFGPAAQNRDGRTGFRAHLLGRIAHVQSLNARKAEKLRKVFEAIRWDRD
jgi:RNA-directed DNA polymerase